MCVGDIPHFNPNCGSHTNSCAVNADFLKPVRTPLSVVNSISWSAEAV